MNTAVIRTDLTDAPGDQDKADRICLAASLFPKSEQGARVGDLDVQVYGQRDRLLASSRGGNGQQARAQQTYIMPAVSDPNYGLP